MRKLFWLLIAAIIAVPALGQEQKPLTNTDIIAMVKAGLPESTIALAISRSPSIFDTSSEALIGLKDKGVSPTILEAMLKSGTTTAPKLPSDSIVPGIPKAAGVYYQTSADKWTDLPMTMPTGSGIGGNPLLAGLRVKAMHGDYIWRGKNAKVQITNTKPVFYARKISVDEPNYNVLIAKVKADKKERRLQATSGGGLSMKTGLQEKDLLETEINLMEDGTIYTIVPKQELEPGEYMLIFNERIFVEFGITEQVSQK